MPVMIEVVGTLTPTELVRGLLSKPEQAVHVYALLGAVLTQKGLLSTPEPLPKQTLPDAIRAHLYENRMTRKQLASTIGISYSYLSGIMAGAKMPSYDVVQKIHAAGIDTTKIEWVA